VKKDCKNLSIHYTSNVAKKRFKMFGEL